jgi:hypothetical protein
MKSCSSATNGTIVPVKRPPRWSLAGVAVLLFALTATAGGFWIRSHTTADGLAGAITPNCGAGVMFDSGSVGVCAARNPGWFRVGGFWEWHRTANPNWLQHRFAGFGWATNSDPHYRFLTVAIPLWLPTSLFLVLGWRCGRRALRKPPAPGACPSCGYDLRATPHRCPECGVVGKIAAVCN